MTAPARYLKMAAIAMQCINFCILALGSGQRYRLGSGFVLGLVFLVSALNELRVSSAGVEVLLSVGVL